jgi:hypothetical protein
LPKLPADPADKNLEVIYRPEEKSQEYLDLKKALLNKLCDEMPEDKKEALRQRIVAMQDPGYITSPALREKAVLIN